MMRSSAPDPTRARARFARRIWLVVVSGLFAGLAAQLPGSAWAQAGMPAAAAPSGGAGANAEAGSGSGSESATRAAADRPLLRVRATLDQAGPVTAGATLTLQLDVLTSTWFTQPPALPTLDLPGALVAAPSGRAQILHLQENGIALSGLRYRYEITPTQGGTLRIPALAVSAQMGQSTSPVQASTAPLALEVKGGQTATLAVQSLQATQSFEASSASLTVGGRITRSVTQQAPGAQAMLIPPVTLGDAPGFRRYPREPEVRTLRDAAGGFTGGVRVDRADYVAEQAGSLALPPLTLHWTDAASGRDQALTLPGQRFEVAPAPAGASPFPVADDLARLGRNLRVSQAILWGVGAAVLLLALGWMLLPWLRRSASALKAAGRQAWNDWQASEARAWCRLRAALRGGVPQRDRLYAWMARAGGAPSLGDLAHRLPDAERDAARQLAAGLYGDNAGSSWRALAGHAGRWRRMLRAGRSDAPGRLHALNTDIIREEVRTP